LHPVRARHDDAHGGLHGERAVAFDVVDAQQPSAALDWAQEPADLFHQARATGGLLAELYAEAFGDEYPDLVDPSSSCTWSVLADMIAGLRLRPGGLLVDLGCGRGGTGLWLARACSARLVGIDLSP